MTDKELLQLAAKAAGLDVQRIRMDDRVNARMKSFSKEVKP